MTKNEKVGLIMVVLIIIYGIFMKNHNFGHKKDLTITLDSTHLYPPAVQGSDGYMTGEEMARFLARVQNGDSNIILHKWVHNMGRDWKTPEPMDSVILTLPLEEGDYLVRSILVVNGKRLWYNQHAHPLKDWKDLDKHGPAVNLESDARLNPKK